jgi:hypothetical protein
MAKKFIGIIDKGSIAPSTPLSGIDTFGHFVSDSHFAGPL